MKKKYFCILFFLFYFLACNNYSAKLDKTDIVKEWIGKEIKFPSSFNKYLSNILPNDTSYFKIFIYMDSIGCSSCKLNFIGWKKFINQIDTLTNKKIQFIFALQPKDIREIKIHAKLNQFEYPLYFDKNHDFDKLNKFPSDISLQVFLLDQNNKVLLLGNPIMNPNIKELYINYILNKQNTESVNTEIEINKTNINLGEFNWKERQEILVQIKNIGENQLKILDIISSCDCTVPEYDSQSALPGEIKNLKITFTAERPEYFERNVIIYCNTNKSPVEVKIRGNAKE